MPTTQSRDGKGRQGGNHRAEADKARDAERRQRGRVRAGIHGLAQRRQPAAVAKNDCDDRDRKRDDHGPHARHRRNRRAAEALLGQEREVETRQNEKRHGEIDRDDHAERQGGNERRRRRVAVVAVMNLRRVEFARRGGAFAHVFVVGRGVGLHRSLSAEAFAAAARCLLGAIEPPQSEGEYNERGDDAQPGRGKRRRDLWLWIPGSRPTAAPRNDRSN